ncbi:hypothetical protein QYE76_050401 [Lolium multiflorum]|uniref:Rab-GAP TBC domain-containing protein n=1 Tax=Lolium multiflorum TaxID=4521 RepID=A0AAD8WGY1_LOLMU|nr:hypothetical protein QYE76_050401 [Lolium multiflorum]
MCRSEMHCLAAWVNCDLVGIKLLSHEGTVCLHAFELSHIMYLMGMSDFLAPILHVMEDESEPFWCFASLMERLRGNFNCDQNGMHAQLLGLSKLVELLDPSLHNYFRQNDCLNYIVCFRWGLIQFKRHLKTWSLDRKLVKQTAMVSVYGVTFIGAHQQIMKILQEKGHITDDTLLYDVNCDYVYFVYTQYLKYYMWDCVNSIF